MKIVGIIPARYDSTRLPGKPLEMIGDKSLIMRVYDQCKKVSEFEDILVATDDDRIFQHVQESGGKAIMTSKSHESGTERCAEVVGKIDLDFDFAINIQGDEPFINPDQIRKLMKSLQNNTEVGTLCMKIEEEAELLDMNIPKVVFDVNGLAMYFSRSLIPAVRDEKSDELTVSGNHYKHIGIYAYRKDILATIVKMEPSRIEKSEQLEQLRWLYNGTRISVVEIPHEKSVSVDTLEDLENARKMLP